MEKKPRLKRDWIGRKVRVRRTMVNGLMEIPAGAIATVRKNLGGLDLTSEPCPHCGIKINIRKVKEFDVELLPLDSKA